MTSSFDSGSGRRGSSRPMFGWTEGGGMISIGYATSVLDTSNYTGIEENLLKQVPREYNLFQNYPNPFNPATKIGFRIPDFEFVSLKIYDILGGEVSTLVNEEKPAGSYEVEFNAANLSSGAYFYKIRAGSFVQTKKMILLR